MDEGLASRVWLSRGLFAAAAALLIFVQLLPIDVRPATWAAPDWLLALTLAWVARRPDHIPVALIAALFLLADFLFQRPPGLWAALVVILSEVLRSRVSRIRTMSFAMEWGTVALGIVAITIINRLAQMIVMTPVAPLGLTIIQMVMTLLFYPLVVAMIHFLFGLSRPGVGQVDSRGGRL